MGSRRPDGSLPKWRERRYLGVHKCLDGLSINAMVRRLQMPWRNIYKCHGGYCARVTNMRCYAEALDGTVYHYHDASGLECDAIVHLRNGSYGLIEIKLGGARLVEEGAKTLESLSGKIDSTRMKSPPLLRTSGATMG